MPTLPRDRVASEEAIERARLVLLGQREQTAPARTRRLRTPAASSTRECGLTALWCRRSAEFLGESDEKPLRPADVAEPIRVFILDQFAYELRTALAEPLQRVVDIVHGEHDA